MELANPCLGFCLRIVGTGLWSVLDNLCVFKTRQAARRLIIPPAQAKVAAGGTASPLDALSRLVQ